MPSAEPPSCGTVLGRLTEKARVIGAVRLARSDTNVAFGFSVAAGVSGRTP